MNKKITSDLASKLKLPAIGSPMFIISNPRLVIAQCKAGIVGSFPALNARPMALFDEWLDEITSELASYDRLNPDAPSAPFGVNQIVHKSNGRLEADVETCIKYKVPIIITSLGAREDVNQAVQSYGGVVLHDVINNRFAHKAIEKGANGLIAVAAGSGGHSGTISPFALIREIREWFDGPLALAGSITHGASILAALAAGADFAYMGTAFIATEEANAKESYKQMIVKTTSADILYTNEFTGVHGNYLIPSIIKSGLDPNNLPGSDPTKMDFSEGGNVEAKAWRDIWGAGHGVGNIQRKLTTGERVAQLTEEFESAKKRLAELLA